jgi:Chromosome segregation protein Spc25
MVFTQLNPDNPEKRFTFELQADDNDAFKVDACQPRIHPRKLDDLLDRVNQTNDLGAFVRGMRRAFVEAL